MTHISIMEGNTMSFVIESGVLKKYIEEPGVTFVEIPEGVTSIDEEAFADCKNVSSVVFPSTFRDERSLGFRSSLVNLEQLKEFLVDEGNPYFTSVEGILYNKKITELLCCPADYYPLKLVIPDGVKYIHYDAFSGCNNLREVIIPDSVECIRFNAFAGCRHLKSVRLPSGIYLEDDTFMGCVELEKLINSENMVGICSNALDLCFSLKKLRLGEMVREGCISESSFGCPNLEEIEVDPSNPDFSSKDGALYNKDKTVLLFCPHGKSGELVLPDSVVQIGNESFSGICDCRNLTSIRLPAGLKRISDYAFAQCPGLDPIQLPDDVERMPSRWS